MINTCARTGAAGHVVAQIAIMCLLELCLMGYLADSRTLGSPPQGNTYTLAIVIL
jgi:hypothetical protein